MPDVNILIYYRISNGNKSTWLFKYNIEIQAINTNAGIIFNS